MISKFVLPPELRSRIEAEARNAHPGECCGLIEGHREAKRAIADALHPVRNAAGSRERFEIGPADHFRVRRTARSNGRAIVGCYHSHPDGRPEPSARDRENPGADDFIWLIVVPGRCSAEMRAFAARNGDLHSLCLSDPVLA